ncbi:MAG: alpha/beta hydrolase [Rhodoferax sp.]|nr:alpha/beta hydrolase [Rhodoferax sp.]
MTHTTINVQGTEVFIEGQGAQTVVCIHGWPDSYRLWDRTVDALKDQHRCVRFTLPGFEGPPQGSALSMAQLTARLLAIVDAVSPGQPVTLLLHDWGCVFGYELAARHPERIARIVAVDIGDARSPQFLKSLSTKQKMMLVFYQVWLAKCWLLGRFVNANFANYWTRMMARKMRCPAPPESIQWYMNYPYAMTWLGVGGGLRGLAVFKPHCPMLYLYGTRKPFLFHSQSWLDTLNARPGSRAQSMKTWHWVMLDQPQEFNATVRDWLGG